MCSCDCCPPTADDVVLSSFTGEVIASFHEWRQEPESVSLVDYGVLKERARILGIVAGAEWSGESLFEDIRDLKRLIEGETK
jgi:hypothetical protein